MQAAVRELEEKMLDEISGINYLVQEFNFDKSMDLLRLIEKPKPGHLEMVLALFKAKKFYEGRRPSLDDVQVLANCLSEVDVTPESLAHMREITRLVLQKIITAVETSPALAEETALRVSTDLKLIRTISKLEELQIIDNHTVSLVLFEVLS